MRRKNMKSEKTLKIDTNPETLWRVLTEPGFTKEYMFNCEVLSDWEKGSSITWEGNFVGYEAFQKGEILEVKPFSLLKYTTFDPNVGLEDVPEHYIHVSYFLKEVEGGRNYLLPTKPSMETRKEWCLSPVVGTW